MIAEIIAAFNTAGDPAATRRLIRDTPFAAVMQLMHARANAEGANLRWATTSAADLEATRATFAAARQAALTSAFDLE